VGYSFCRSQKKWGGQHIVILTSTATKYLTIRIDHKRVPSEKNNNNGEKTASFPSLPKNALGQAFFGIIIIIFPIFSLRNFFAKYRLALSIVDPNKRL